MEFSTLEIHDIVGEEQTQGYYPKRKVVNKYIFTDKGQWCSKYNVWSQRILDVNPDFTY